MYACIGKKTRVLLCTAANERRDNGATLHARTTYIKYIIEQEKGHRPELVYVCIVFICIYIYSYLDAKRRATNQKHPIENLAPRYFVTSI